MVPVQPSFAQVAVVMPPVGQMIHITGHFEPPQMVGLKINLKDPFSFGFIMDQGENPMSDAVKKEEFNKIIKYFLVSLAMPNKDMWVNLSPFESKRIIPEVFGQTEMGRDLLAQDYVLKQFTASLMYPEEGLGKQFWNRVYSEAQARFGTTDINVNTFNKVWIVADHADVYQKGDTAFLVGSHLKVMLEQDFRAIEQNKEQFGDVDALAKTSDDAKTRMASQIVREIIIPAIEKEVNEGQSFAAVRQIYNAEIMATWFKKTLRASLLGQVFADKSRIAGQQVSDPQAKEKIFQQYLAAYRQGVFNFIKQETTPDGQVIPRRYLSGGAIAPSETNDQAMATGVPTVQALPPEAAIPPSPTVVASDTQTLAGQLSQVQTPEFRALIEKQFATPTFSNSNLESMVQGIASSTQISPQDRAQTIARLVANSMPSAQTTDVSGLAAKLQELLSKAHEAGDVMNMLADEVPNINPSAPVDPAMMAQAVSETPQLRQNPADAAQLVENIKVQPQAAVAEEVQQFGTNGASLVGEKRLDLAQVSLAPAEQAPVDSFATVQDHLNTIMPQIAGLQQNFTAYQGPDVSLLQQDSSDIQSALEALKEQQAALTAQINNGTSAAPSVVVPQIDRVMPQVRVLQANLTALQNRVNDAVLKQAIVKVTANLESAMAGLQQQRNTLAAQNTPTAAPVATVQDQFSAMMPEVTNLQGSLNAYQGPDTNIVQQNNSDIGNILSALKDQENEILAQNNNEAASAPTVKLAQVNRAIPQVRVLQANLTALQNRVSDATLKQSIASVTSNLENALANLQQQRNVLAAQINNASTAAPVAAVQDQFSAVMPEVTNLQGSLNAYQGPDASLVQQSNGDIESALAALKEQQAALTAQINSATKAVPSVMVPQIDRVMPQARVLQANLTALQNRVNDAALKQEIVKVTANLESAMAGLQQQRDQLAAQASNAAPVENAQLTQNPGGINLSNEHLTMDIKVDGAGMPLPPQYQDKAMLNLNGLISIIRSITPLTQQNVPALYQLTQAQAPSAA
jgi:hypothetical protein